MKYVIYKIENKKNGKVYIGAHKTEDVNDGYMGSGIYLRKAIKKHGIENFQKEILFSFQNQKEMYQKEAELVDEAFVKRKDTYNIALGGVGGDGRYIRVKDKQGKELVVDKDDVRILSGELTNVKKGKFVVKDKDGNKFMVSKDDPRYLSGELVSMFKGTVIAIDQEGNKIRVDKNDPRLETGELVNHLKDKFNAVDRDGNILKVSRSDKRLKTGELVPFNTGMREHRKPMTKHTEESKRKISEAAKRRAAPSEETKRKISEANKGKKRSEETKQKIREYQLSNKRSKEWCENISKAKKGIPKSEETKRKMSEIAKSRKRDEKGRLI